MRKIIGLMCQGMAQHGKFSKISAFDLSFVLDGHKISLICGRLLQNCCMGNKNGLICGRGAVYMLALRAGREIGGKS